MLAWTSINLSEENLNSRTGEKQVKLTTILKPLFLKTDLRHLRSFALKFQHFQKFSALVSDILQRR